MFKSIRNGFRSGLWQVSRDITIAIGMTYGIKLAARAIAEMKLRKEKKRTIQLSRHQYFAQLAKNYYASKEGVNSNKNTMKMN